MLGDKRFAYIDKASDLTLSMVEKYKEAFILLGDEKQLFNPLTNSYVGISQSAYNYVLERLNNITASSADASKIIVTDRNEEFNVSLNNVTGNDYGVTYTSPFIKYNPSKQLLSSTYFKGDLIGTSYFSYYANISYFSPVKNTNEDQSYYVTFSNTNTNNQSSYSYVNNDLVYNPLDKTLMTDIFDGQVDPEDQWGVMGEDSTPIETHDYVEIGGIKWATMNLGASSVTDYGLYFQWGDTQGYTAEQVGSGEGQKYFGWADYKYGNGTSSPGATGMTKYNATDGLTTLEAVDDAAVANWGGSWRMPTTAEFQALGASVNTEWTQVNNVYGILCTDKTDSSKTLFFPAAGFCNDGSVRSVGDIGGCWSSSLRTGSRQGAYYFGFSNGDAYWDFLSRYYGLAVRAVLDM